MSDRPGETLFAEIEESELTHRGVERGTMMGAECLRVGGEFYAMVDRRNGGLIVKLPAERIAELIAAGRGQAFAPAGKVFREWLFVAEPDVEVWRGLVDEARRFVARRSVAAD